MSIKIIGGEAKGFSLNVPHESITRPTSILLRRRLFDFYQNLQGYYFIDLCAGSGSVALEAASRGANPIHCLELNEKAFSTLKVNISNFQEKFENLEVEINYEKDDFRKWFIRFERFYKGLSDDEKKQVILYFDPPYEQIELYSSFFDCIEKINFKGIAVSEACKQKTMTQEAFSQRFGEPTRRYKQGTSFLFLYDYN